MSDSDTETEARATLPVVVTVVGERYEIDLYRLPRRARIWAEKKTGLTLTDWFRNRGKLLLESAEVGSAIAAVAIAVGRDIDPDDVYEDLLDRDDEYAKVLIGLTAADLAAQEAGEDGSGPTEPSASASRGSSTRKQRTTGAQSSKQ